MDKKKLVSVLFEDKKEICENNEDFKVGDDVVAQNEIGLFVGKVVSFTDKEQTTADIVRKASEKDIKKNDENK